MGVGKHQSFGAKETHTFEDRRDHVIPRTRCSREPVVEVPQVADGQQHDADISSAAGESERRYPLPRRFINSIPYQDEQNLAEGKTNDGKTSMKDRRKFRTGGKIVPKPHRAFRTVHSPFRWDRDQETAVRIPRERRRHLRSEERKKSEIA